jgi:hypothetical protein
VMWWLWWEMQWRGQRLMMGGDATVGDPVHTCEYC